MSVGESRDREAGTAVGGQPTDDDPAAAPRFSDGQRREIRVVAAEAEVIKN